MKNTKDYKEIEGLAYSVGAGVVLFAGHETVKIFPFEDSMLLNRLKRVRDEKEYTIRDVDDKEDESASKGLTAALLVAFINDLDRFYLLMKKDHKTLGNLTIILFALVILLIGVIIV